MGKIGKIIMGITGWGALLISLILVIIPFTPFIFLSLSPNYHHPRSGPFEEAHLRAVNSFVASDDFGIRRFKKANLWNEGSVTLGCETRYRPRKIRLIGTTPEYGDRLFLKDRPPHKDWISKTKSRPLSTIETAAIERFRSPTDSNSKGESEELPLEPGTASDAVRIVAPIYASQDCLQCHSAKEGDLLGAFEYLLLPE